MENDRRGRVRANNWLIAAVALVAAFACLGFGQKAYAAVCASVSDDFNGSALDEGKWDTHLREVPGSWRFEDGQFQVRAQGGDMNPHNNGNDNTARNILLQTMPDSAWTATGKIDASESIVGDQIGLAIWRSETPNQTWGKAVLNHRSDSGGTMFFIERNATVENATIPGSFFTGPLVPFANLTDGALWIRLTSTGGATPSISTQYSINGTDFTNLGTGSQTYTLGGSGDIKVGFLARTDSGTNIERWHGIDEFTVDAADCPPVVSVTASASDIETDENVTFTATASDDETDTGDLDVSWEFGDGNTASDTLNPTHSYDDPGTYKATVYVTDEADLTTSRSVTVTVVDPGSGSDPCIADFNGNALNTSSDDALKWSVLSRLNGGPAVSGGAVQVPMARNGEVLTSNFRTTQMPFVDVPTGRGWTVTAQFNTGDIDVNGEQAGLAFIESAGSLPGTNNNSLNYFSKAVYIRPATTEEPRRFEHGVTSWAATDFPVGNNAISNTAAPAPLDGSGDHDILMRGTYDGTFLVAEFSDDDGATWTQIGQPAKMANPTSVGLIALGNNSLTNVNDSGGADGPADGIVEFSSLEVDCGPEVEVDSSIQSGRGPLNVDFSATISDAHDDAEDLEIEWDLGDGTTVSDETEVSHTYSVPGTYRVTATVTDSDGNVGGNTTTVTVDLDQSGNCLTAQSDNFDGNELGPKWTNDLRARPSIITVEDGELLLRADGGDMHGTNASAKNVLLQEAPAGAWIAQTEIDVSDLTSIGDQTGIVLWRSENPNHFAKFVFNRRAAGPTGAFWFETSRTVNGSTSGTGAGNTGNVGSSQTSVLMRVTSDGAQPNPNLVAQYSLNGGTTWVNGGGTYPMQVSGSGPLNIGIAYWQGNAYRHAKFDHFTVTEVGCDDVLPEVEHEVTPAAPDGPDGAWLTGASLEISATDDVSDPEDIEIEYSINGGSWQGYSSPIVFNDAGDYDVDYRATDENFNVGTGSASLEVVEGATSNACTLADYSDEFDGIELDDKWTVHNPDPAGNLRVEGGELRHNLLGGDIGGNFGGPSGGKNTVRQPVPSGAWVATTKMDISNLNAGSNQVGFVLWSSGNVSGDGASRQWTKMPMAHRGGDLYWFEYNNRNGGTTTGANTGNQSERPGVIWERVSSDGANPPNIRVDYSLDGQNWRQVGTGFTLSAAAVPNLHIGLAGFNGPALNSSVAFDYMRLCDPALDTEAPTLDLVTTPDSGDGTGGAYTGSVTVDLQADDGDGSGVALREYRINEGPWITFVKPFQLLNDGDHEIEYRATDLAGNATTVGSETITIDRSGETCTDTDSFDGSTLDPKWSTQLRTTGLTVSGGNLNFPFVSGTDFYGGNSNGRAILQDVPADASWSATTMVDVNAINGASGAQVGLIAWKSEGSGTNNFTKMILNRRGTNNFWIEWGRTINSSGANANGGEFSTASVSHVGVRAVYDHDGQALSLFFSMDEGATWNPVNAPTLRGVNFGDDYKVGLVAMGSNSTALFADFTLDTGDCALAADVTPPETTHSLTPAAADGPDGAWLPGVQVALAATDDRSIPANITSEYSLDEGDTWNPYTAPVQLNSVGEHEVQYRSTDLAGNVETAKSVTVEVAIDSSGSCDPSSDDFAGTTLDSKWDVLNASGSDPLTIDSGHLVLPLINGGDIYQSSAPPANTILQDVPSGSWVATAKIAHEGIDGAVNGKGAGLALVNALNPNYYAKSALQYKEDADPSTPGDQPGIWAERVMTVNNVAQVLPGDGGVAWPNSGLLTPDDDYVWVRMVHNANTDVYSTWTSVDGLEFKRYGQNMPAASFDQNDGDLQLGLFGKHDQGPSGNRDGEVEIDFFNVVGGTANPQLGAEDCPVADTEDPVTTATFDPATPDGSGGAWLPGVEVSLSATDNVSDPADIDTEYSLDGGTTWDAYTSPIVFNDEDDYELLYRSTDEAGNTEDPPGSSEFTVATAPVDATCLNLSDYSDDFNGTTLDPKWTVNNPDAGGNLAVADGKVGWNIQSGDIGGSFGGGGGAKNVLLQPMPQGSPWVATIEMDISGVTAGNNQVGFVLWAQGQVAGDGANRHWAKLPMAHRGGSLFWFEWAYRNGDATSGQNTGNQPDRPDVMYERLSSDGANPPTLRVDWSRDGVNWSPVGNPNTFTVSTAMANNLHVGLAGFNGNGNQSIGFESFNLCDPTTDNVAPTTSPAFVPESGVGTGGAYTVPVKLGFEANDGPGGSGVSHTEFRIDGGDWRLSSSPVTLVNDGTYEIEYRSVDMAGNTEAIKSTEVTIDRSDTSCVIDTDEFDTLDLDKWDVSLRAGAITTGGGNLQIPITNSDFNGATATAPALLQSAPAGSWSVETFVDAESIGATHSNQAGLLFWQSEGAGANTFTKMVLNHRVTPTPGAWIERVHNVNSANVGGFPNAGLFTPAPGAVIGLRANYNHATTTLTFQHSFDNGDTWIDTNLPPVVHDYGEGTITRVGVSAFGAGGASGTALLPSFTLENEDCVVVDDGDNEAPVTTATFDPATPDGSGGAWLPGVEVSLSATDNVSDPADIDTEYSLDGGTTWDAYTSPVVFNVEDDYELLYRSTDEAGNTEDPPGSSEFTVATDTSDPCTPQSDQFDSGTLDSKWTVLSPNATDPLTFDDGHLVMPLVRGGDIYTTNAPPSNTIVQDAPANGPWVATAKIKWAGIDGAVAGKGAGLAMIHQLSPNYYAKSALQYKGAADTGTGSPGLWSERVMTTNNQAQIIPPDTVAWPNSGVLDPADEYLWVRIVFDEDAGVYTTWTSEDGVTFNTYGAPMLASNFTQNTNPMRIGLFGKHDTNPTGNRNGEVEIDYFNVVEGTANPQLQGDDCGGGVPDTTPPVSTHAFSPAVPDGPDGAWLPGVQISVSATDNISDPDDIEIEYSIDGGTNWLPYTGPVTVDPVGEYEVLYRATDEAGNTEDPPNSFEFEVATSTPTDPCVAMSDDFSGTTLDSKWEILRDQPANRSLGGGNLNLTMTNSDMIAGTATTPNILLQDAPAGEWTATVKLNRDNIDVNGRQAGLIIWKSEGPNNFVKISHIFASGTPRFERAYTSNDGGVTPHTNTVNQGHTITGSDVWVRAIHNGNAQFTLQYSLNGTDFVNIFNPDVGDNNPEDFSSLDEPVKIGLHAMRGNTGNNASVAFDSFEMSCEGDDPDPTEPTINLTVPPADGAAGWHVTSPVNVGVAVADPDDQVETVEYRLGNTGPWTTYTSGPIAVAAEGTTTVNVRALDDDDDVLVSESAEVRIDTVSGASAHTVTPPAPNGLEGWYTSPVNVGITATDATSGVNRIEHRLTASGAFTPTAGATASVALNTDGTHTVEYRSVDNAGNVEDDDSTDEIKVDATAPTTVAALSPPGPVADGPVTVTLTATDAAGGSGVASTEYSLDEGDNWIEYAAPFVLATNGEHTVTFRSTDIAGNEEAEDSISVEIDTDVDDDPPIVQDIGNRPAPFVMPLELSPGLDISRIEFRITAQPGTANPNGWQVYEANKPISLIILGQYRIDYRWFDSNNNASPIAAVLVNVVPPPVPPARLAPSLNKKKFNVPAKRKQVKFNVRVRNTGGTASNPIRVCVSGPKKKVGFKGGKCRTIRPLNVGATSTQRFTVKLKKKLKGSRANVKVRITSPGHVNRQLTVVVRQKKR